MLESSVLFKSQSSVALAGELRISLGKLVRRLREHARAGDISNAQKSVRRRL